MIQQRDVPATLQNSVYFLMCLRVRKPFGYLHEVWFCPDGEWGLLPACIALGQVGDAARALIGAGSVCVWVFWANSHLETMRIYNEFVGYGEYQTEHACDREPYPVSWITQQDIYLEKL